MGAFLFGDKLIMRMTKNWGFVNSKAELYMLAHAERHRKAKEKAVRKYNEAKRQVDEGNTLSR